MQVACWGVVLYIPPVRKVGLSELVEHRKKIGTGWEWGVRCSKEREKVPECKISMCMVGERWEENNHLPVDS